MKKGILGLSILAIIMLSGCTKTQPSTISFDEFSTTIKSPNMYKQNRVTSKNTGIQKVYTTTESGFKSSIIIANETVMSGDSISFANEGLKGLRENLKNKGEIKETNTIELSCGDTDIPASLSLIETKNNGTSRYVSQLYFVYKQKGYIVSHVTENEDEANRIQNGFEDIACITK